MHLNMHAFAPPRIYTLESYTAGQVRCCRQTSPLPIFALCLPFTIALMPWCFASLPHNVASLPHNVAPCQADCQASCLCSSNIEGNLPLHTQNHRQLACAQAGPKAACRGTGKMTRQTEDDQAE